MKKYLSLYTALENKIFGDKVSAHPYFASLVILSSALLGVFSIGSSALEDMFDNNGVYRSCIGHC